MLMLGVRKLANKLNCLQCMHNFNYYAFAAYHRNTKERHLIIYRQWTHTKELDLICNDLTIDDVCEKVFKLMGYKFERGIK